MNKANKITVSRVILSILIITILIFPFHQINLKMPEYLINGHVMLYVKYLVVGLLFAIASATDFVDGHLARKHNMITDFGKTLDAIADKILVNGVLIILANDGFIPVIIPVIIITRDIIVDSIKMIGSKNDGAVAASITGKIKTVFMMTGVTLVLLSNLPFSLLNIPLGNYLIIIATLLSVYSGIEYYIAHKDNFEDK